VTLHTGSGDASAPYSLTVMASAPGKSATKRLLPVEFEKYQEAYGFDDTENPRRQSVPLKSTAQGTNYLRRVKFVTSAEMADKFEFEVEPSGRVTVTPEAPSGGTIVLRLVGESLGEATLKAKLKDGGQVAREMKLDVLKRKDKTLSIKVVTDSNSKLPPHNVPTQQQVHTFMQDSWSVQANVYFEVDVDGCGEQPYDKSGEGYLDVHAQGSTSLTAEELWLKRYIEIRGSQDCKVAVVRQFLKAPEFATLGYYVGGGIAFMDSATFSSKVVTIGHEVGHIMLRGTKADHNESSKLNLMYPVNQGLPKPEVRHYEWDFLQNK
jgi:hypothetical protein